jgi:hypothetical protein
MQVDPSIHRVFGHFQNLNLLVLLEDLRAGHTAHGAWIRGDSLCPLAHGMPDGQLVSDLQYLAHTAEMDRSCRYAARHLGATPEQLLQFIGRWDENALTADWLIRQLESLWAERLADADAVQSVLVPAAVAAC